MSVLVSDNIQGWRRDSKIERAAIRILSFQISFKFRRGGVSKTKELAFSFQRTIRSFFPCLFLRGHRAD